MGPRPRVLLVVVLALSAGCAGLFGGNSQTDPVTPVPELDPPAPGVPAPDQPGVGQVSVDADRLAAANEQARANATYTLERTVVVRGPNGTMRIERTRLSGDGDVALERLSIDGSGKLSSVVENGTLWTNGTTTWTRTRLSNGRTVTNRLVGSSPEPYGFGVDLAGHVLAGASFEVAPRDGRAGAVLDSRRAFSMSLPLVPLATGPAENATARLVVDGDGLVRALDLSYGASLGDQQLRVDIQHRVVDRGTTRTVSRPEWVPTTESTDGAIAARSNQSESTAVEKTG
ncbi:MULTISPECIES: hypothetical protein [Salinibaculum]|uniref:hypothetical protein n=1 Tax=Salinibaculum TaxID=2732368 RepID=UPI0030D3A796